MLGVGVLFLLLGIIISLYCSNRPAPCAIRVGDTYLLCDYQKIEFLEKGLAILPGLLDDWELQSIGAIYDKYMREGSPEKQGRDFCDMVNETIICVIRHH